MWQPCHNILNTNSTRKEEGKNCRRMKWYYLQSHICNFHKVSSAVSLICYGTHIHCRTSHSYFYLSFFFHFALLCIFFQDHITKCLTWCAEYNRQNCYIDFCAFCWVAPRFSYCFIFVFHKLSMNKWILSILIQFSIGGFYGVFKITFLWDR